MKAKPEAPMICAAGHTSMIFVRIPNERGRYLRTHLCVAYKPCGHCGAKLGEPCKNMLRKSGKVRYSGDTHYARRFSFKDEMFEAKHRALALPVPEDEEGGEALGQPWVLAKHSKQHPDMWGWFSNKGGWSGGHFDVRMFPSEQAATDQKDRLGSATLFELKAMPLSRAQQIWNEQQHAAEGKDIAP